VAALARYQISRGLAVESFQKWAAENTTPLQLLFETAEMAELSKASLGDLLRTIGKLFTLDGGQLCALRGLVVVGQRCGSRGPPREAEAERTGTSLTL
jgi:hypothetical protein